MKSVLEYQTDKAKKFFELFFKYVETDIPFFIHERDILLTMDKNNSNYFRVPRRHSANQRELYFYFDIIYLKENKNIKLYRFDHLEMR